MSEKYQKVIELINSFKGKFRCPNVEDKIDFTQFILPATDELPCLVITPYNIFGIHAHQAKQEGRKEILDKLKKDYPEVDVDKL